MAEKGVSLRSFFRYDKDRVWSLKVGWMMVEEESEVQHFVKRKGQQ